LKSLHEVVVQNRLEQLRKRQRDEALQAQQELLAGVSVPQKRRRGWAHAGEEVAIASSAVPEKEAEILPPDEEVEEYDRSMSPVPIDLSSLPYEERQLEIIDELTDRSNLVRHSMMNLRN
jgi:cactin